MPLTTSLLLQVQAALTGVADYGSPSSSPVLDIRYATTDGTGANQNDIIWADERTVASAANDDLDLAGSLTNVFGQTVNFAELTGIIIVNAPRSGAANTTNLTLGVGTNPVVGYLGGTTPTVGPMRPGHVFLEWNSENASGLCAITAGTGDILRIANSSGAPATYQIWLIGRSA